jgi:hypothetical protein
MKIKEKVTVFYAEYKDILIFAGVASGIAMALILVGYVACKIFN